MTDERKMLRNMILELRVSELYSLLVTFGVKKISYKHDRRLLQYQAVKLLSELPSNLFDIFAYAVQILHSRIGHPASLMHNLSMYRSEFSKSLMTIPSMLLPQENSPVNRFQNIDTDRLRQTVFFEPSLYEILTDVCPVRLLVPKNKRNRTYYLYESCFSIDNDLRNDEQNQIILRIGIADKDMSVIYDSSPPGLEVYVNNTWCSVPSIYTSDPTCHSSAFKPIDLTSAVAVNNRSTQHYLAVTWPSKYNIILYSYAVQVIRRKSCEKLVEYLKAKGEQSVLISKEIIRRNLEDNSDEIAATTWKISLVCPLSKMLISLPTRATTCNHLQCFDGRTYIKMNEIRNIWKCPICNQSCIFENLIVDGYFLDILRSDRFEPDKTEVHINVDGSWYYPSEKGVKRSVNSDDEVPSKKLRIKPINCTQEKNFLSVEQKSELSINITSDVEAKTNVSIDENPDSMSNMGSSSLFSESNRSPIIKPTQANSKYSLFQISNTLEARTNYSNLSPISKTSEECKKNGNLNLSCRISKKSRKASNLSPMNGTPKKMVVNALSKNTIQLVDISDSSSDIDCNEMDFIKENVNRSPPLYNIDSD